MLIYTIAQVKAAKKQKKPDVPATLARTPAERKLRWPSHVHAKVSHTHTHTQRCRDHAEMPMVTPTKTPERLIDGMQQDGWTDGPREGERHS